MFFFSVGFMVKLLFSLVNTKVSSLHLNLHLSYAKECKIIQKLPYSGIRCVVCSSSGILYILRLSSKISIFVLQKVAAPRNGVDFHQKPNGASRCCPATSYESVLYRNFFNTTYTQSQMSVLLRTTKIKITLNMKITTSRNMI